MIFSLLVTGGLDTQAPSTAYYFAKAALEQGHKLCRVFFYQEAVNLVTEINAALFFQWQALAQHYQLNVVVCSTALQQRNLDCSQDSFFIASGLGQWVEAVLQSDRTITFVG